ncbi:MAG: pyridoxamine 5'-phosphate oxidase family protein [Deltaproteobacteria bacterium]|nr:pyridoxamine 5'-phosphate oxidase family protein [Deltaproteobacteria bacterium]
MSLLRNDSPSEETVDPTSKAVAEADELLHRARFGTLCTASLREEGWPFGSIVPYTVDSSGRPLVLLAGIAEHTRNLLAEPRVSLLVHERADDGDVQSRGRLTIMARAARLDESQTTEARARYLARVPQAVTYFETHDFEFYALEPHRLRYIGGFGKIHWLPVDRYRDRYQMDLLAASAPPILSHMNQDHSEALRLIVRAFRSIDAARAIMSSLDRWGFMVRTEQPDALLRFDFDSPADSSSIRGIMVDLTKRARASTRA